MRYFEFIAPSISSRDKTMHDTLAIMGYDLRKLREGSPNKSGRILLESQEVDRFKEFISHLLNDPSDLHIGQEYNAYCVMFDSSNRTIKTITYIDLSYSGIANNEYIFKDLDGEEYFLHRVEDYGHSIFATILYEDKKLAGQYQTLLVNKYGGNYEFEWH